MHCGLCLNACPTYRELGLEMDSPRGRIYQMIQVEKGRLPMGESFVRHIDLCLDCRSCETACPSGVEYGKLVELARGQIEKYYHRPPLTTLFRKLFYYEILPHPGRLQFAGKLLRMYQRSGLEKLVLASGVLKLLPGRLDQVAQLAPRMEKPFFYERLGKTFPAEGKQHYRVALFAGCIANLSFARLNDATVRVLTKNGCEVVIPRDQGCCGALHVHAGIRGIARDLAKRNIQVFLAGGFDAIISNAAGCGSVLKEYPLLFEEEDKEFHEPAKAFVAKLRDVTEFLAGIDLNRKLGMMKVRATYQDPCHLGHAQRIRTAPRKLLAAIPGTGTDRTEGSGYLLRQRRCLQRRPQRDVGAVARKQNAPHRRDAGGSGSDRQSGLPVAVARRCEARGQPAARAARHRIAGRSVQNCRLTIDDCRCCAGCQLSDRKHKMRHLLPEVDRLLVTCQSINRQSSIANPIRGFHYVHESAGGHE